MIFRGFYGVFARFYGGFDGFFSPSSSSQFPASEQLSTASAPKKPQGANLDLPSD